MTGSRYVASVFVLILVFVPLAGLSEVLKPLPRAANEKGTSAASAKGEPMRWTSEWTMQHDNAEGKPIVRFTEKGSGRYSSFDREVRWSVETIWTADGSFRPLRSERTVTDMTGRPLMTERKSFRFDKGTVEIERQELPAGSKSRRALNIPPDTVTVDGIGGALRSLPFERSAPFKLHVLSNEPKLYEVSFEPRGVERIRTPAGEFNCYKVEMRPNVGILNVFSFVIPKAYFWFTVDPPHYWVRYEGPENGRGTPQINLELTGFELEK
jgi:hypothetical protein